MEAKRGQTALRMTKTFPLNLLAQNDFQLGDGVGEGLDVGVGDEVGVADSLGVGETLGSEPARAG